MTTQIIVENVMIHQAEKKLFNQPELRDIDFIYKGNRIEISPEELNFFEFTGLSNIDFIMMRMWDDIPIEKTGNYVKDPCPKDLNDAVNNILIQLTGANISDIKHVDKEFSNSCLNGMAIRNDWDLWYESPLTLWFAKQGIYHADDMFGIISYAVWLSVNNLGMLDIKKEAAFYQEYWKKSDCDVKSEFEERCKNKD